MSPTAAPSRVTARVVHIAAEHGSLTAELMIPDAPAGVIVLARTNAAHRQARYDHQLAAMLLDRGFATLVLDLLTPVEELVDAPTMALRVDVALLSRRLIETIDWLDTEPAVAELPVGLMGEGPGAAAAFVAACVRHERVAAIVSYAESLDRAQPVLPRVKAPSLVVAGGADEDSLRSNDRAYRQLLCSKQLVCLATGQFATTGDADTEVSQLAADWFVRKMTPASIDVYC